MTTVEQWQRLLDQYRETARRCAAVTDWYRAAPLQAGASEADLAAAEMRLGRPLHPDHRRLLSLADGGQLLYLEFLGTADIGQGPKWRASMENLDIWATDVPGALAESLGVEDSWTDCVAVVHDRNTYAGHAYVFTEDRAGHRAGSTFGVTDAAHPASDLFSWLSAGLQADRRHVTQLELGEWSAAWAGRDLRRHPPSSREILDRIADLAAQLGVPGPRRRPGAGTAALDELEQTLGVSLAPEHRGLLATSDGVDLPGFRHLLSVAEITDRPAWDLHVSRAVTAEQALLDRIPEPERLPAAAPVSTRVGAIPYVPFGYSLGSLTDHHDVYGVDTRDGFVRNLIRDLQVGHGVYEAASSGVDDHLLRYCHRLWRQTQTYPESR